MSCIGGRKCSVDYLIDYFNLSIDEKRLHTAFYDVEVLIELLIKCAHEFSNKQFADCLNDWILGYFIPKRYFLLTNYRFK